MTELLTAAQMRAIEQAAIESGEVTGLELMERAGQGVVEAIFEEWPELDTPGKRAVVLCGPGNNGGDGFVIARLLKDRGWEVEVFLYGDPDKLPPDAKMNYERWVELEEVKLFPVNHEGVFPTDFGLHQEAELVIDALFGTGLVRPIGDSISKALAALRSYFPASYTRWIAVDVPSGICADSGKLLLEGREELWTAYAMTVSFHSLKLGHLLCSTLVELGKLVVKGIGLNGSVLVFAGGDGCPVVPPGDIV